MGIVDQAIQDRIGQRRIREACVPGVDGELRDQHGVTISMTDKGEAWQNGYAERLTLAPHGTAVPRQVCAASTGVRTVKEEEVDLSDYQDYNDAITPSGGGRKIWPA